jgi:predicted permease
VTVLRVAWARLRGLFEGGRATQALDHEIDTHLDLLTEEYVRSGMSRPSARAAARRDFGSVQLVREKHRDQRGIPWLDDLIRDFRYAGRSLWQSPTYTAVVVLTLGLGIGANTSIFSVVNSLLLRPLPVVEPQRLAVVVDSRGSQGITGLWTYAIWEQMRQRAQPFDGSCAWWTERLNIAPSGRETQPIDAMWVSGDYFKTLGVPTLLGRPIEPRDDIGDEDARGAVAVISYELWQRRFAGAANAIGMPLFVERVPFTIVGVTPPSFFGAEVGRTFDVALPMNAEALIRGTERRMSVQSGYAALTVLFRLKPHQSADTATTFMRGVQPQIRDAAVPVTIPPSFRKEYLKDPFVVVLATTGTSRLRAQYERPIVVILVVVALVLLIACADIANLQLARAISRRYELSVRMALGASRWRLARQWFMESLVLSAGGVGLGLLFASWSSQLLIAQLSTVVNRVYLDTSVDWRVLAFAIGATVATTVLFGSLPALHAARVAPMEALREPVRGSSSHGPVGLSSGLVIAQVAVSVVIVVAAGLFLRSFERLATLPLGFDSDRVLLVSVHVAHTHVATSNRVAFFDQLVRRIAAVPGVAKAAGSMNTPVTGLGMVDIVHVPGTTTSFLPTVNGKLAPQSTFMNVVTPGWFATYGTSIRAGRDFDDRDAKGRPAAIIVNEAFVRKFLPGKQPVGAVIEFERGRDAPVPKTIVGVVANSVYGSLRNADAATPTEYAPLAQNDFPGPPSADLTISVRVAAGAPMRMARSIAAALTAMDPDLVFEFRPMTDQVSANLIQERIVAALSGFFGLLALLLAGLGLYGITAYRVNRRRAEIGIRLALGATGTAIVRVFVARTARLVAFGIVIGTVLSLWLSAFVSSLLFRLNPRDPLTLFWVITLLGGVSLAAAYIPARRAARLDPAVTLRYE